tara:strand:- start:393 stop:578 length:186 start_codon:yes stop_codon:yes gene_type:complete
LALAPGNIKEKVMTIKTFWKKVDDTQEAYNNSTNDVTKQIWHLKLLNLMMMLEQVESRIND